MLNNILGDIPLLPHEILMTSLLMNMQSISP